MRSRATAGAAAIVAVALLAGGCSGANGRTAGETRPMQGYYEQELDWSECGDGFDCAKLRVPLDYGRPQGEQIRISVIRLPATGEKIGSILINPGGPGGSGLDYGRAARSVLSPQLRARFDMVGFDPRGVGESAPVRCLSGERLDAFIALDATPDSRAELTVLEEGSRRFAAGCQEQSAKLLPHIGTVDAARDMDVLRAALGDNGLTYLGKSYGTYLGARYAELFPGRVRALVLDGALDPALSRIGWNEGQAQGFETALRAYATDCLAAGSCPFRSRTVEGALGEVGELLRRTDSKPLRGEGRQVTEALATLGALTPLYDRRSWPQLTDALSLARQGDGSLLLRSADHLLGRAGDGTYSNQTEANMAVNCVDSSYPREVSAFEQAATRAATQSPRFGRYIMWSSLPCAFWPVPPTGESKPLRAEGAAPILVVGTRRDPATPYEWAKSLAEGLESGVFLGFDGDGHTAYLNGSPCVDGFVDRYLITGKPPRDGTLCPDIR